MLRSGQKEGAKKTGIDSTQNMPVNDGIYACKIYACKINLTGRLLINISRLVLFRNTKVAVGKQISQTRYLL